MWKHPARASCWSGLVLVGFLIVPSGAFAQISPGPLSRAHQDLEGASQCHKCHKTGGTRSSMNEDCMDCHKEIAWQVARDLGLHGREKAEDCAGCHPDHAGQDFDLIHWEEGSPEAFDHARTGWPLEGRHAALRCAECHKQAFQSGGVMELTKRKEPGSSWLGLERPCLSCHVDQHLGTLGTDCTQCHRNTKWKPAAHFDHARTSFPLTGKHADLTCEKCHLVPGKIFLEDAEGKLLPMYKPLPHQECSACHADPHRDQLGPECSRCHVTTDFKQVDRQAFDHSRTRFPLRGRHAKAECAKCHDPQKAWGKKPSFDTCSGCHTDPHAGKATRQERQVDCSSCHDETAFRPSRYTVLDHRESRFALEGKHIEVACDRCHTRQPPGSSDPELGSAGVLIRPKYAACQDCHADVHGGQLAGRKEGAACDSCHRVDGWKPSTYDAVRHAELDLALEGRHAEVKCSACHGPHREDLGELPGADKLGRAGVALTLIDPACRTCHLDPHAGRFDIGGARTRDAGCVDCHAMTAFRPSRVNAELHGRFEFILDGGHRAVPCVLCHEELREPPSSMRLLRLDGALRTLRFEMPDRRCAKCHQTPHGNQFATRPDGGSCEACHVAESFRPAARFDHELHADFALSGAHRDVACAKCHPTTTEEDGQPIVLYRPIPHTCRDCHANLTSNSMPSGEVR